VPRAPTLGKGCGIQALLAASTPTAWCDRRESEGNSASRRFNAALNGIDTIELRLGDGFEPDRRASASDLIARTAVCESRPTARYAYRDKRPPADEAVPPVVETSGRRTLTEEASAHVLVSWAHAAAGGDWAEPLRRVGRGRRLRRVAPALSDERPGRTWPRLASPARRERCRSHVLALDRWLEYLERLGIEAIGYGAVVRVAAPAAATGLAPIRSARRLEPAGEQTLACSPPMTPSSSSTTRASSTCRSRSWRTTGPRRLAAPTAGCSSRIRRSS